jgi:hypothetical protein
VDLNFLINYNQNKSYFFTTFSRYDVWILKKENNPRETLKKKDDSDEDENTEEKKEKKLKNYIKKCLLNIPKIINEEKIPKIKKKLILIGKLTNLSEKIVSEHHNSDWITSCFAGEASYMFLDGFSFLRSNSKTFVGQTKLGRLEGFLFISIFIF